MGSEWVTFQEIAELIRQSANPEDMDDNTPYIGLEHIEEGTLRLVGIGRAKTVTSTKFRFSKGDILFGKLRPYFRKVIRPDFDGVCSTDIWVVQAKQGVDQGYLYYWMASNDFVNFATQGSEGTKMPRAKWEHVGRFQRLRLSEYEQHAIAHILGSLDDKIELNRRMNKTLEAIARAIFKSWFIDFDPVIDNALQAGNPIPDSMAERAEMRRQILDQNQPSSSSFISQRAKNRKYSGGFDFSGLGEITIDEIYGLFPDSFQDSELGPIPKGWEVVFLPKIIDINPVRTIKRGQIAPYLEMRNIPEYSARVLDWYNRAFGSGTKFINGDTLMARITPCLENGKGAYVDFLKENQVGWGSTEYIVFRAKKPLPLEYSYFLSRTKDFRSHAIVNMTGSSGRQRVPVSIFESYRIVKPSEKVAECYGIFSGSIMQKIKMNDEESYTLASLRDTLLPKLISGELRIPDVEKFLKET